MAGVAAVIERLRDAILAHDNLRIAQLLCGTLDGTPLDPGTLAHPSNVPVLHLAVSRSNLWAVSMLLLSGADVDVTGQWGVKAMMLAVLQSSCSLCSSSAHTEQHGFTHTRTTPPPKELGASALTSYSGLLRPGSGSPSFSLGTPCSASCPRRSTTSA